MYRELVMREIDIDNSKLASAGLENIVERDDSVMMAVVNEETGEEVLAVDTSAFEEIEKEQLPEQYDNNIGGGTFIKYGAAVGSIEINKDAEQKMLEEWEDENA